MNNIEKIKPSGIFTNYIFKAIPLAFDESMSYYETLCGLLNYLKNVIIPTLNNNADAVAELQSLYEQLKNYVENYFTNLDVQQEINNKLDEMVKDGTIQSMLENYLNLINVRYYDTFIDALNDINNIPLNYYIATNGYNQIGDNGNAKYKIENTNKGVGLQFGENYANIIPENNKINVKSLGIIGSETVNYTSQIQTLIDYAYNNNKIEIEFNNENYYITYLQFKTNINGNGCTFYSGYFNSNNPVVIDYAENNIICKNYTVDALRLGSLANVRTDLRNKNNIKLINVHTQNFIDTATKNAWGLLITSSHNIYLENCSGENATQSDTAIVENSTVKLYKCTYEKLNIEPNNADNLVNVDIDSCNINYVSGIGNSRTKMYVTLNIINSIINEISPLEITLNAFNSILKTINCYSSYAKGSFRGNILNCISQGKELNINPYFENVIPETGATLQNGYTGGYVPGPLNDSIAYKIINGVGNLLTINPNKHLSMNLFTDKYNITAGKMYMFHLKYIGETTTAANIGILMQPRFYDSNDVSLLEGDWYSGVMSVNENTGIQDEYIIVVAPENSVKCDINIQTGYGTGEYQLIECSIKQINTITTNI